MERFGVVLQLSLLCFALSKDLPSNWKVCRLSEPDFNGCLKIAVEGALNDLSEGDKSFGLPAIDPLRVESLHIGAGKSAVSFEQNFNNVLIYGAGKTTVKDVKFSGSVDTAYGLDITSLSKRIDMKAEYEFNGKVLLIPISGHGNCSIKMTDVEIEHNIRFQPFKRNGVVYTSIKSYKVTTKPKKIVFYFDNLFDGKNKELADNVNAVLNENWKEVYEDVRPGYDEAYGIIFKNYSEMIFTKVPLDKMFPK